MQHIINILSLFSIYLIVAYSFTIIYMATKYFHLAQAAIIAFAAYFIFAFTRQWQLDFGVAVVVSITLSILLGISINQFIYRPLQKQKAKELSYLIASLGVYLILQNIISLIWHDDAKSIRTSSMGESYSLFDANITDIQMYTITISLLTMCFVWGLLKYSNLGKNLRALSENENLSIICGINTKRVVTQIFVVGSALAAIAGILQGLDADITPTMGFGTLLYGIVAMIIGGVGNTWGLAKGALLLAVAQHLGAYFIESSWMNAIAYIILILFLIWKPLGFSGKRLKKVEI